ncbi:hypothetical protein MHBO_002041 [Bonamia ostreae]|uniref:Uncharacterized protein n=1 Tax=Bonamia ostreae TaxID=126728 RepID=A0ABV2ALK3_9EUKA
MPEKRFRNKVFKSADRLVSWFKSHPYENSPYVKRKSAPKNYNRNEHSRNHDRDDGYNNRRANFRNRVDFDSRNSSQRYQQPNRYYSGNKNFDDDSHRNFTKRNYENVNRNFGRNEKNFDNRRFENSHKNVKQSPRYQEPQHQFSRPSPRGYSNRPQNESKNYGDYKRPQNRSHIEKSNYGRRGNYDRRGNNFGHNNSEGYGNNSYRSRTGHDNRRSERDFNDGNRNWNSQKNFAKNGLSRSGDSGKFHNFVSNSPEVDFDQFDQIDNDSGRKRVRDPKRDEKNLVEVPKSDKKQKLGDSVSPEPDFAEFDKIDNDN